MIIRNKEKKKDLISIRCTKNTKKLFKTYVIESDFESAEDALINLINIAGYAKKKIREGLEI